MNNRFTWQRLVVGLTAILFLATAFLKIVDPTRVIALFRFFGPEPWLDIAPGLLIGAEVILGIGLIIGLVVRGLTLKWLIFGSMVYLVIMMMGLLYLKRLGISGDCGCLGPLPMSIDWAAFRNFVFIGLLMIAVSSPENGQNQSQGLLKLPTRVVVLLGLIVSGSIAKPLLSARTSRAQLEEAAGGRLVIQVSKSCPHCHRLLEELRELEGQEALSRRIAFIGDVEKSSLPDGAILLAGIQPFAPVNPVVLRFNNGRLCKEGLGGYAVRIALGMPLNPKLTNHSVSR